MFLFKGHFKGWYLIKGRVKVKSDHCNGRLIIRFKDKEEAKKLPISKRGVINFIFPIKEKADAIEVVACSKCNPEVIEPLKLKKLNTLERLLRMYRRILPVFFDRNLPNIELVEYLNLSLLDALFHPVRTYYRITYTRQDRSCEVVSYQEWISRYDTLSDEERERLKRVGRKLKKKVSLLIPVFGIEEVEGVLKSVESVISQLYQRWELFVGCEDKKVYNLVKERVLQGGKVKIFLSEDVYGDFLKRAEGDYVGVIFPGDTLSERALLCCVSFLDKRTAVLYTDSDSLRGGRRIDPRFKPDWNYEYFLSYDYVHNFILFRRKELEEAGGIKKEFGSYVLYEALLRVSRLVGRKGIRHLPLVLYHAVNDNREKDWDKGLKALEENLKEDKNVERIEKGKFKGTFRVVYKPPHNSPLVSIVIPTKDRPEFIKRCIGSIFEKTTYGNYELVIVDNGTTDERALDFLKSISSKENVRLIRYDIPFNFPKLVNLGVKHAEGDYIVLLNNDVEVITPDWIEEMLRYASLKDVGVVGVKLYYPDGRIQHAGVIIGIWGVSDHAFKGVDGKKPGYMFRAVVPQEVSAVTAACMMFRKRIFYEIGGFDEKHFPINFNDTDFCLRVKEKGYRVIFTPYAELYHYEHGTRKVDDDKDIKKERKNFIKRWRKYVEEDPAYNINLSLYRNDYVIWAPRKRYCFW